MTSKSDDDIDIYEDLPNFNLEETIQKLENENKVLTQQVHELTSKAGQLEASNMDLKKLNKNLSANISVLYKTAKLELDRKDNTIQELTRERDDIFFRRFKFSRPKDRVQSTNCRWDAPIFYSESIPLLKVKNGPCRDSNGNDPQEDERRDSEQRKRLSDLNQKNSREEEPTISSSKETISTEEEKGHQDEEPPVLDSREKKTYNLGEESGRKGEAVTLESSGASSNVKHKSRQEEDSLTFESRARRSSNSRGQKREDESLISRQGEKMPKERKIFISESKKEASSNSKRKIEEVKNNSLSDSRKEKTSDSRRKSYREEESAMSKLNEYEHGKEKFADKKEKSSREVHRSRSELRKEKSSSLQEKEKNRREENSSMSKRGKDELQKGMVAEKEEKNHREVKPLTSELRKEKFSTLKEKSRREEKSSASERDEDEIQKGKVSEKEEKCRRKVKSSTSEREKDELQKVKVAEEEEKGRREERSSISEREKDELQKGKVSEKEEKCRRKVKSSTSEREKDELQKVKVAEEEEKGRREERSSISEREKDELQKGKVAEKEEQNRRKEKSFASEREKDKLQNEEVKKEGKNRREERSLISEREKDELQKEKVIEKKDSCNKEIKPSTSEFRKEKMFSVKGKEKNRTVEESLASGGKEDDIRTEKVFEEKQMSRRLEQFSDVKEDCRKEKEHPASEAGEENSCDLKRKSSKEEESELMNGKASNSKTNSRQIMLATSELIVEHSFRLRKRIRRDDGSSTLDGRGEASPSRKEEGCRDPFRFESEPGKHVSSQEEAKRKELPSCPGPRRSSRQGAKSVNDGGINVTEKSVTERQIAHIQRASKVPVKDIQEVSDENLSRPKSSQSFSNVESDLSVRKDTDSVSLSLNSSGNVSGDVNKNKSSRLSLSLKRQNNSAEEDVPVVLSVIEGKHAKAQNDEAQAAPLTTTNDNLTILLNGASEVEISPTLLDVQLEENISFSEVLKVRGEEALMEPPELSQEIQSINEISTPETSRDTGCGKDSLNTSLSPKRKSSRNSRVYVKTRSSPRLSAKLQTAVNQINTETPNDVSLLQVLQLEEICRTSTSPRVPSKSFNEAPSSPLPTLVSDLQGVLKFPSFTSLTNNISDSTAENVHRCLVASVLGESAPVVADLTPGLIIRQFPLTSQKPAQPSDSAARSSLPAAREETPCEEISIFSPGNSLHEPSRDSPVVKNLDEMCEGPSDAVSDSPAMPPAGILPCEEISIVSANDLPSSRSSGLNWTDVARDNVSKSSTALTGVSLVPSAPTKTIREESVCNLLTVSGDPCSPPEKCTGEERSGVFGFSAESSNTAAHPVTTSNDKLAQKANFVSLTLQGDSPLLHSSTKEVHQIEGTSRSVAPECSEVFYGTVGGDGNMQEDISSLFSVLGNSPAAARKEVGCDEVAAPLAVVSNRNTNFASRIGGKEALCSLSSMAVETASFDEVPSLTTCDSFKVPFSIANRSEVQSENFDTVATQVDDAISSSAAMGSNKRSRRDSFSLSIQDSSVKHFGAPGSGVEVAGIPLYILHRKASHKRTLSDSVLVKDLLIQQPEIERVDESREKVPSLPNNASDQSALKCFNPQVDSTNSKIISHEVQISKTDNKPDTNSQCLQWDFKVRRRTKVEVKIVMKSPPPAPTPSASATVNKTVHDVHHRARSRSRSPPRSHTRENHPPRRPDVCHRRRPKDRRSPFRCRARSPPYRRSPGHRPSRKDDRQAHGFDFSRRSRSCSPFIRTHHRRDRVEHHQHPDKVLTNKRPRESYMIGKSQARDSASSNHNPCQKPQDRPEPKRPLVMTVNRRRKSVKLEDSFEDKDASSASVKPASLSSSNRLVQTPLDFRERYAEVFSNTGESSDSGTDGLAFSDSESSKSIDSDVSYRPKGGKRKKARVSKAETKRPRIEPRR